MTSRQTDGMHLLIVDDNAVFDRTLGRALARLGHRAETAENPEQAISAARRIRLDAVVLDLRLGEHSGMALIDTLQAANPQARIPMLTGYASIATAIYAIKQGAYDYLPKPATARQILAVLASSEPGVDNTPPASRTSLRRLE